MSRLSTAIARLAARALPQAWMAALATRAGYEAPQAKQLPPPPLRRTWEESLRVRSAEDEEANGIYPLQVFAETRWDPIQRDEAMRLGDAGNFRGIALMIDAMRSDGLISGIGDTLTDGLTRLDAKWSGDPWLVARFRGVPATFDEEGLLVDPGMSGDMDRMLPSAEQAAVMWDGIFGGLGIGELVPQADGGPPILQHLDLHWVRYWYSTDEYHYTTAHGSDLVITPGDGRWVLYTPYGRRRPWARGKWWATALPFIQKQNAAFDRLRWHRDLADPLKTIEAGKGAEEKHRDGLIAWLKKGWRRAAGLVTPPGYKAALVESNGRGYEVYSEGEKRADIEIQVAVAGQLVSATGTNGLGGKADLWDRIESGRVSKYADTWADTVNRDVVRPEARRRHGVPDARAPRFALDARSPAQRTAEATAMKQAADAFSSVQAMIERVEPDSVLDLDAALAEQGLAMPRKPRTRPLPAERSNVLPMRRVA